MCFLTRTLVSYDGKAVWLMAGATWSQEIRKNVFHESRPSYDECVGGSENTTFCVADFERTATLLMYISAGGRKLPSSPRRYSRSFCLVPSGGSKPFGVQRRDVSVTSREIARDGGTSSRHRNNLQRTSSKSRHFPYTPINRHQQRIAVKNRSSLLRSASTCLHNFPTARIRKVPLRLASVVPPRRPQSLTVNTVNHSRRRTPMSYK